MLSMNTAGFSVVVLNRHAGTIPSGSMRIERPTTDVVTVDILGRLEVHLPKRRFHESEFNRIVAAPKMHGSMAALVMCPISAPVVLANVDE